MPIPKKGQTKKEFMNICMPELINEGKDKEQAFAQCNSVWDQHLKEGKTVTVSGFESPVFGDDLSKKGIEILGSAYASCRASWVKDHPKDKENADNKRMCSQIAWGAVEKVGERKTKESEIKDIDELLREAIRPLFGSPGGKTRLSKLILSYFPDHKTYVEPFCGGASVFFSKKKTDIEILNDKDFQIFNALKAFKENDLETIQKASDKYNWNITKEKWSQTKDSKQEGIPGLLDFFYALRSSFAASRTSYAPSLDGTQRKPVFSVKSFERIKDAVITNKDYKEIIQEYDSPDTLFYIDLPYESGWRGPTNGIDWNEFQETLKGIKGKLILSINKSSKVRNWFPDFKVKTVRQMRSFQRAGQKGRGEIYEESLFFNFDHIKNSSWLVESIKPLQELKHPADYDPSGEDDSSILMDDFRFLASQYSIINLGGKTNFRSSDQLIKITSRAIEKIIDLGEITFHPEQMKKTSIDLLCESLKKIIASGPCLDAPHGELVWRGKQKAIVRLTENRKLEDMGILSSGSLAYGFIRFYPPEDIDLNNFTDKQDEHKMVESELTENRSNLLSYRIREFIPFESPQQLENPDILFKDDERFFESTIQLKDWDLSGLTRGEILKTHSQVHDEATQFSLTTSKPPDKGLIDRHALITSELKNRKIDHLILTELDKLSKEINLDETIKLSELTKILKEGFTIRKPFLSFIGESCISGWGKNLDIHIDWPGHDTKFLDLIKFKLQSLLPPNLKESIKLVSDYKGPEVNFIPFAEITLKIIPPEARTLMRMAEADISGPALREARITDIKMKRQAEQSRKEDKVELFRFFSQIGNIPGVSNPVLSSIDDTVKAVNEKWVKGEKFPQIHINQKFPETRAQIHKSNDKVLILNENGKDVTELFPNIVEEAKKHDIDFIVDTNITHDPEKEVYKANVFDAVLILEDIHNKPLSERRGLLQKLKSGKHFDIAEKRFVKNEEDLKIELKNFSNLPGSKGAVLKLWDSKYPLEGTSEKWMELKK